MYNYFTYDVAITRYEMSDGKWNMTDRESRRMTQKQVDTILSDSAQPYEESHRLFKQAKGRHKYDSYETIFSEGGVRQKCIWYVDFSSRR